MAKQQIGGGAKKVLYTLNTLRKIGPVKATKALRAKNTCKACALGMGGQNGGMVNEIGEFPSVCNKSVQAQSTDIQPEIPNEIFTHTIAEIAELSSKELEGLGRLNTPLYKAKGRDRFLPVSWDESLDIATRRLAATAPDRSFFYASGRSSNEAAFVFQLLARAYGTNNVTNCSYYCHQATGVALSSTIGTGTATVELADLGKSDLIFVIGANPASNHPRFIHQLKHCRDRSGEVVIINPAKEPGLVKFAIPKSPKSLLSGGSEIASHYVQPKIGGDIALLKGIAKSILERQAEDRKFIDNFTDAFEAYENDLQATPWNDLVEASGVSQQDIERVAALYAKAERAVFAWGMGVTHHTYGVENVESIAALAMLRGMLGKPGAGLLPLRGHSNVQGVGTIGVKPVLAEDVIARIEEHFDLKLPPKRGLDTMASMQQAASGNVDAAVIMGGNLLAANPNTEWARGALESIAFRLCLTTTLNQSHVHGVSASEMLILPVTARDEEWEPTTQESMFNFVRMSDGGIHRLSNVRPESVILADLGERLLPDSPIEFSAFKRHKHIREAIAEIVPGMQELASIDIAKKEFHIANRLLHEPKFYTQNGKARFAVTSIPSPRRDDAPFMLATVRSEGQFNSIIYEEADSYRGTVSRWCVMMNPDDLDGLGLPKGATATIRSSQGQMENVELIPFDLPSGSVLAYYPEANALTNTEIDPRSKTPGFKSTPVWIEASRETN
ncbi:MAG: FdhF/YdeP family oxidoreductase [Pseudomonadota bacterium]